MRAGTDILRAGSANPDSTELRDVIIFRRDDDGLLREQIYAETATLAGDRWNLDKVVIYYRGALTPNRLDSLVYSGAMKPAAAGARSGAPEEMSLRDLSYFIENAGFGIRPVWVYETWWHKRVSLFFSALLMIASGHPAGQQVPTRRRIGRAVRGGRRAGIYLFRGGRHGRHHGRTGLRHTVAGSLGPRHRLRGTGGGADAAGREGLTAKVDAAPCHLHRDCDLADDTQN